MGFINDRAAHLDVKSILLVVLTLLVGPVFSSDGDEYLTIIYDDFTDEDLAVWLRRGYLGCAGDPECSVLLGDLMEYAENMVNNAYRKGFVGRNLTRDLAVARQEFEDGNHESAERSVFIALNAMEKKGYYTPPEERYERLETVGYSWRHEHDGYYFMNTSNENDLGFGPTAFSSSGRLTIAYLGPVEGRILGTGRFFDKYLYGGFQIRLRCGNDNKLHAGGGVTGYWGFGRVGSDGLRFESYSPESASPLLGFWAVAVVNGTFSMRESLPMIDITEWHNYTILWEPEGATFLVDDEVVATADTAPGTPMDVVAEISDKSYDPPSVSLSECGEWIPPPVWWWKEMVSDVDVWIQIDHLHVWTTARRIEDLFSVAQRKTAQVEGLLPATRREDIATAHDKAQKALANLDYFEATASLGKVISICEMPELIYLAEDALRVMGELGWDVGNAMDAHGAILGDLNGSGRVWGHDVLMDVIAWREVAEQDLFDQASAVVGAAEKGGLDARRLGCLYSAAQDAWSEVAGSNFDEGRHLRAMIYLDLIVVEDLRPPLLAMLCATLLAALGNRRSGFSLRLDKKG